MQTHALSFIQDLAIIMIIAGLVTVLCHRFKQPVVLGYIVAGIIIGPHTPPFSYIHDEDTIKILAELGIVFIMFSLGLEFNLRKLSKIGLVVTLTALVEIIVMSLLGYAIGCMLNWSFNDSIFLGAMIAISSTTIIIKALNELGLKNENFAQLIFGILIVEDIFGIAILGLLSGIAETGSIDPKEVIISLSKLSSFLVVSLILGLLIIPRLLEYIAKFKSKEMLLIAVLGICFGFCFLVIQFNYSIALGAFIVGAIMAESRQLATIEKLIEPLRDMFSAIFFVSVGLLFDPSIVALYIIPIMGITLTVVIGKILTCSLTTLLTGRDGKTAVRVGMGLAQIGEFSFIIAAFGITLKVTSSFLYPIAVVVSVITTLLTPYLMRYSDNVTYGLSLIMPKKITQGFDHYKNWLQHIHTNLANTPASKMLRLSIAHIIINILLIMAVFFGLAYLAHINWEIAFINFSSEDIEKSFFWIVSFILSIPFIFVAYKNIKVLSLFVINGNKPSAKKNMLMGALKCFFGEIIPVIALITIVFFISWISIKPTPSLAIMFVVTLLIIVFVALLYPWLTRAQIFLQKKIMGAFKQKISKKDNK